MEDDNEALTEDWLRSIEADLKARGVGWCSTINPIALSHFWIEHRPNDGKGPTYIQCSMIKTRSRLRLLLAAFGR